MLMATGANAQNTVQVSELNDSYKGAFGRITVGYGFGHAEYQPVTTGETLYPLHLDLIAGKRLGRVAAPYFNIHMNTQLRATAGLSAFQETGMGLGCHFYVLNPNAYFAPELGLEILMLEEAQGNDYTDNMGGYFTLNAGYDHLLFPGFFIGGKLFFTYFMARDIDDSYNQGSGYVLGAAFSVKFGK